MEWKLQDLGGRPGYPQWHAYAIRDAVTNVHIATVGNVDRYFEGNTLEHAQLIVTAPELLDVLRGAVAMWADTWPDEDINGADCVDWLVGEFLPAAKAAIAKTKVEAAPAKAAPTGEVDAP